MEQDGNTKVYDLEKREPTPPEFEAFKYHDKFETVDEANSAMDEAEQVLFGLKMIQQTIVAADQMMTEQWKKSSNDRQYRRRFVLDEALTETSNLLEDMDALRKQIDAQVARWTQFAKDCEDTAGAIEDQERDDEEFGTYEEQHRYP